MKKEDIKIGTKFHFKKYPTEDYIIDSVGKNAIGYHAVSCTHTFAAGATIQYIEEQAEKTVIQHVQV